MKSYGKIFTISILVVLLTGCGRSNQSLDNAFTQPDKAEQKVDTATMKRFHESTQEGPSAVESALELSKKYAVLSEEVSNLKLEKQETEKENAQLKQQAGVLEQELNQAKKELSEANDLLVEMRIELNNWKEDVLGFRDEMRRADKVQLETLVKILKALGGEVDTTTLTEENSTDQSVQDDENL